MGNKKNKCSHYNSHRHAFKKRVHYANKKYLVDTHGSTEKIAALEGSRIINLDKLQQYMNNLKVHTTQCGGDIILTGEKKGGLASIISSKCSQCNHVIKLDTSRKVKGPRGYLRWECNLAAVWGQMSTGGGHSTLQESMGTLGVPVMAERHFINTERDIGHFWQKQLQESMIQAGKEEKRLAEERGDFCEGVPAITVIVDGGWSKRSHRHSYNAKSGVGIIIGHATGKLLHNGVRNKYCTACTQGIPLDQHTCYKNWDKSSSEMETDIILEGFQQAERVHGVRYKRFVGDGNSSVHPTLIANVSGWGRHIEKLECANHACKCYRSGLEKLVQNKPHYKGRGRLTQRMRCRLTSSARCAIKMRSKESDIAKAVKLLAQDLQNGPFHCFGHHEKCSPDFCLSAKKRVQMDCNVDMSSSEEDVGDDRDTHQLDDLACKFPAKELYMCETCTMLLLF